MKGLLVCHLGCRFSQGPIPVLSAADYTETDQFRSWLEVRDHVHCRTESVSDLTASELAAHVGPIPLWRNRHDPPPGTATEEDMERYRREESLICELIDGVLVENVVCDESAGLAVDFAALLHKFTTGR